MATPPSFKNLHQLTAKAIANHQAMHEHHRTLAQRAAGATHPPPAHVVPAPPGSAPPR